MTQEDTGQQLWCRLHSSFGSHTLLVLWTPTGWPIVKGVYTGFNVPCSLEDHWAILVIGYHPPKTKISRGAQSGQKQLGSRTLTVSSLWMGAAERETWLPSEWYKDIHRRRLREDQEGAAAEGWPLTTPHIRFPWKEIWVATSSILFKETLRIYFTIPHPSKLPSLLW